MSIKKSVVDDNILIKDKTSTAGSKILYNFVTPFNSAVFEKLTEAGCVSVGQAVSNEFSVSLTGSFGCVEALAKGEADIGIGCDVNGSIKIGRAHV